MSQKPPRHSELNMKVSTSNQFVRHAKNLQTQLLLETSNARKLLLYHRLGKLILGKSKRRGEYGKAAIGALGKSIGLSIGQAYYLRHFAMTYSRRDVQLLSKRAPNAKISHVHHLVTVKNTKKRCAFERQLHENNWSPSALLRAIKSHTGKRRNGGGQVKQRKPMDIVGEMRERVNVVRLMSESHDEVLARSARGSNSQRIGAEIVQLSKLAKALHQDLARKARWFQN